MEGLVHLEPQQGITALVNADILTSLKLITMMMVTLKFYHLQITLVIESMVMSLVCRLQARHDDIHMSCQQANPLFQLPEKTRMTPEQRSTIP